VIPTHNIMSRTRKTLLPKLQRLAATAVQGGLSETTRTCGNPTCACHQDPGRRHGPHLYLTFRTPDGRSSALYVPREHEPTVRKAVQAWAQLWETIVEISHGKPWPVQCVGGRARGRLLQGGNGPDGREKVLSRLL
jgi:hypothetical protein